MIKRMSVILGTMCLGLTLSAQSGIVSTRPANDQSGKILTMEETILSRDLSPENLWTTWKSGSELVIGSSDGWKVLDLSTGEFGEFVREPERKLEAVTKGQSLFLKDKDGNERAIAESENSQITYGQYVSRNEFGIDGGIFWAPDSSKVAFYRKDESKVTDFPLLDITSRTGSLVEIKYPMAGMDSESLGLGIYDLSSGTTVYADVKDFGDDRYLTNISWSPDASRIFIQVLDRSQKHMKLNMYCSESGELVKTLLTEENDKFIEPQNPIWFMKDSDDVFVYRTDNRDGYRNLYLCDMDGNVRRLAATDADMEYLGNDGRYVWYTSAEVSPIENHLFKVEVKGLNKGLLKARFGNPQRLTEEEGWHSISLSPDCRNYVDSYSSLCVPRVVNLRNAEGKLIRNLLTADDPTMDYAYTEISLGTVRSADGRFDNYYRLIKPKDFDPTKKYPVIVYVYGGPHSQMVQNSYMGLLRRWEMYMAQRGYLVYVQDNRGTSNRGAEFEKAIHGQCGQAEMADQIEGVRMLMELPYVDKERIGVHGWSYGGFMTISLITNYPEIFKVGVAGGPVIDWKWYEVMYGERYMDHPDRNPDGYAKTSLINKAKDLKGKLLICQGAIDPVVLWEHSLSFVRECVKNNVQVDYFPYPCAEHNVMGKDRVHLHDKITMYFEDYL